MKAALLIAGVLPLAVLADDVLKTDGYSVCSNSSDIKVQKMNIEYNKATGKVIFDVAGTSAKQQNVTAALTASAYGKEVYRKEFNPCDQATFVAQLCPIPAGNFSAQGEQDIPDSYASQIPAIAFSVPDLDGGAKLELKSLDSGDELACIQSVVTNGKTADVPAVKYVAAGIAAAALLMSGLSALGSAGAGAGASTPSPTFSEVFGWFQSMALNGMLSVQYPSIYRSFTKNFAFSGGLIPWDDMQSTIDSFRNRTGGNLTEDSIAYLRNATLVYTPNTDVTSNVTKRSLEFLLGRDTSFGVNGTTFGDSNSSTSASQQKVMHYVSGIQAYSEQLLIPQSNTFMTALLIFAIVIAAIIVGILFFKVILETWALFGTFPKRLTGFRKRYWWTMAKTITNLILLVYGIWVLYCIYQFTDGDSWAAKLLAGVTLAIFTTVLIGFTYRIWSLAHKFKNANDGTSVLYDDKKVWRRYSIFYENYKKSYWWIFVPTIVYLFARGCVIAGANKHGLIQTGGQLIIESIMLILLLWSRPYGLRSGNWINIIIQVVRVLSVVCILVFVEQLGIAQTTKTVTGLVLIIMQSVLTALLAILIAVNAIVMCCKQNPHRKQRKEAEKLARERDDLTPLDPHNSLLLSTAYKNPDAKATRVSVHSPLNAFTGQRGYEPLPHAEPAHEQRGYHNPRGYAADNQQQYGYYNQPQHPQPTLPAVSLP